LLKLHIVSRCAFSRGFVFWQFVWRLWASASVLRGQVCGVDDLGLLSVSGQDADFDGAEVDGVAVVLEEEVAGVVFGEVGVFGIFAAGDEGVEHLVVALVFDEEDVVEVVFDVIALDADEELVPAVPFDAFSVGGVWWDEVVEGAEGAVSGGAPFGVGVVSVVEELVLGSDELAFFGCGIDEVFDAGVSTFSEAEVEFEFEVAEGLA